MYAVPTDPPHPLLPPPSLQGRKGSQTTKNNVNLKSFVGFPAERVRAVCCCWGSLRPVWRPTARAGGRGTDIGRYERHKSYGYFILFQQQQQGDEHRILDGMKVKKNIVFSSLLTV
jgi:hypothetical protein